MKIIPTTSSQYGQFSPNCLCTLGNLATWRDWTQNPVKAFHSSSPQIEKLHLLGSVTMCDSPMMLPNNRQTSDILAEHTFGKL